MWSNKTEMESNAPNAWLAELNAARIAKEDPASAPTPPAAPTAWAARPRRKPYQPPPPRRAAAPAPASVRDELFARNLQEGIKEYRHAYDGYASTHFDALRAPAGSEARTSAAGPAGAGPVARLAHAQATSHVSGITAFVGDAAPGEGDSHGRAGVGAARGVVGSCTGAAWSSAGAGGNRMERAAPGRATGRVPP